ncbi:aldehyde dehydrogenase family protein [Paucibacter sp. DJ2R-2]|uniref:L-piperidine-6-carboxylate dehydrogenase n=1 Tax=Paucibacter sp. DJ2R-2 TaxID=2893558 RepID=UPI0021E46C5F|nr:aldehyde dehydrogenase family protein [Paucibacter sp. DJ2R-2]MCV2419798.1 aldehyde dehydrogenase family protein [Paucibacter sp. DJ4R-1]MCV2437299.1 aldehyde dehydrogenase family protein [Paucibacter sp. DJ2R-2]
MTTHITELLSALGVPSSAFTGGTLNVRSPIDGAALGAVHEASAEDMRAAVARAHAAFLDWRNVPAPKRGELVRLFGEELRAHKMDLARLVSLEAGKVSSEGEGEVQEMIDICDFAVGLSRQLHGLTIASERPGHRMMEQYLPLGVVGIISAFNFPVAVWAWNSALALVCGDSCIWKPSEKTPLTAIATQALFERALARYNAAGGTAPAHLSQLLNGGAAVGEAMVDHPQVALVSATGSTRMGRAVGPRVAARFGRCLLELGGNNAIIVTPSADLELAVRGILFGAYGTAGQRCTTTRRVIIHESIHDELVARLDRARAQLKIGSPVEAGTLIGPLIDGASFESMQKALAAAREQGGEVSGGERALANQYPNAWYATPALVRMPAQTDIVKHETFAPILYTLKYKTLDEAIALQNEVPQGLSSAIFSNDVREAEAFMSASGSDCGIANVNIGTSGAEIGGAFGGEKETGGGRESGSDAWKAYMRRTTNTVNYSRSLPLAQGVKFDI